MSLKNFCFLKNKRFLDTTCSGATPNAPGEGENDLDMIPNVLFSACCTLTTGKEYTRVLWSSVFCLLEKSSTFPDQVYGFSDRNSYPSERWRNECTNYEGCGAETVTFGCFKGPVLKKEAFSV